MRNEKMNYQREWYDLRDANQERLRKQSISHPTDADVARNALGMYKLKCFCERLRRQYAAPWLGLTQVDAARLYLINKHHWHPEQVKGFDLGSLLLVLHEELVQLRLTDEEFAPVRDWTSHLQCRDEIQASAQPEEPGQ